MSLIDDVNFGVDNEKLLIDKFNDYFLENFERYEDNYSVFDFHNHNERVILELKSRKLPSTHYYFKDSLMIGRNKIEKGYELEMDAVDVYIIFSFSDGVILWYKINEKSLDECKLEQGGRCDRGIDERRLCRYVPRNLCKVMEN